MAVDSSDDFPSSSPSNGSGSNSGLASSWLLLLPSFILRVAIRLRRMAMGSIAFVKINTTRRTTEKQYCGAITEILASMCFGFILVSWG